MKRFSLAQLEAFAAIVRLGSFQAAAACLNVTQPTISLRIRELESALGARLFKRDRRQICLTAEGTLTIRYAIRTLGILDEFEAVLQSGDALCGTLRLGSSEMMAITVLPQIIQRLEARYPQLKVEITVANSFILCDKLSSDQLDIAFLANPAPSSKIRIELLTGADVGWMGSAVKPIPVEMLAPRDLRDLNVLSVPPPSPLHDILMRWCMTDDLFPPRLNTCNSIAIIAKLIRAGVGIAVMPVCVLADELQMGSVVRYKQTPEFPPLKVCAAYPRASSISGLETVIATARSVMRESSHFSASPLH